MVDFVINKILILATIFTTNCVMEAIEQIDVKRNGCYSFPFQTAFYGQRFSQGRECLPNLLKNQKKLYESVHFYPFFRWRH